MMNWLWRFLRPRVNALITRRILLFHAVMVRRGQIPDIGEQGTHDED